MYAKCICILSRPARQENLECASSAHPVCLWQIWNQKSPFVWSGYEYKTYVAWRSIYLLLCCLDPLCAKKRSSRGVNLKQCKSSGNTKAHIAKITEGRFLRGPINSVGNISGNSTVTLTKYFGRRRSSRVKSFTFFLAPFVHVASKALPLLCCNRLAYFILKRLGLEFAWVFNTTNSLLLHKNAVPTACFHGDAIIISRAKTAFSRYCVITRLVHIMITGYLEAHIELVLCLFNVLM